MKFIQYFLLILVTSSYAVAQNNLLPNTADCSASRPPFNFNIESAWKSETNQRVDSRHTPIVGDIDDDGDVEVFASNGSPGGGGVLYVFMGKTGALKGQINCPGIGTGYSNGFCLFKRSKTGRGSVFIAGRDGKIYLYEVENSSKSSVTFKEVWSHSFRVGNCLPVVADLNGDGNVEIVAGKYILDANTGSLLSTLAMDGGGNVHSQTISQSFPLVADLDKDGLPEVIVGTYVYKFNNGFVSSPTPWKICPQYNNATEGANIAADINQDGNIDLVLVSAPSPTCRVTIWTPVTNSIIGTFTFPVGNSVSYPFVGDIDGEVINGKKYPEICINTANKLRAYKYDGSSFSLKWDMSHTDGSGATILTLFDFNLDGIVELVYRDEKQLRILNGSGSTPSNATTPIACGSATIVETPVIADVTGDGSADIIVTGNVGGTTSVSGEVMVFEGKDSKWASCPNVWNQQLYSPLLVNNDLTIPRTVKSPNLEYTQTCDGKVGNKVQYYNGGPMQAPYISTTTYCPMDLAPDLFIVNGTITVTASQVTFNFTVGNQGMATAPASTPIQFYKESIKQTNRLNPPITLGADLAPGQTRVFSSTFNVSPMPTQFYIRVMDDGVNFPASGPYSDCDLTNNWKSFGTIELSKTILSTSGCLNGVNTFTVSIKNNEKTTRNNIIVVDSLGEGLSYISSSASKGTYVNGVFGQWNIPSLAPNESANLTLLAKANKIGTLRNTSWISSIGGLPLNREDKSAYATVSTTEAPAKPSINPSGPLIVCNGNSIVLSTSGGAKYQWYKNGMLYGVVTTAYSISVNTSGDYSVSAISAEGCVSVPSNSVNVTLVAPPGISTNLNNQAYCPNIQVPSQLIAGTVGATFNWTNSNTAIGLAASGTGNIPSFTSKNTGNTTLTSTITITPIQGNCIGTSKTYTISIYPKPQKPTITVVGDLNFCAGGNAQLISSSASNNQWYKNNVAIPALDGGTQQTYTATSSGSYTLKITNSNNCESDLSEAKIVTVYPIPTAPTISADKTAACQGEQITLTASLNAVSYQWYKNGSKIDGAKGKTYSANQSGNYQVTLTDANGCTSLKSASEDLTIHPLPTAGISGSKVICESSAPTSLEVSLTGTPPWRITYTDGVTPITVNNILSNPYTISGLKPNTTTTYRVTEVKDAKGCSNTGLGTGTVYVQPCGFGTPMMVWLKADKGANHTGGVMDTWEDQSGSGSQDTPAQTQGGNEILLKENAINFNPSVSFSGKPSHFMQGSTKEYFPGVYTMFTIAKKGKNVNNEIRKGVFSSYNLSSLNGVMGPGLVYVEQGGDLYYVVDGENTDKTKSASSASMNSSMDLPNLLQTVNQTPAGSTENSLLYKNGKLNTLNYGPSYSQVSTSAKTFAIGGRRAGVSDYSSNFDGEIAEIIFFPNMLTVADRDKSTSYLAIKYGIHLHEKDYVSSDGNLVWTYLNKSSYHTEVAGIAKDKGYELDQRISKNENPGTDLVTICKGGIFSTNKSVLLKEAKDKTYLMWGNNNRAKEFAPFNGNRALFKRIWAVQLSGKQKDTISMQFNLSGVNIPNDKKVISLLISSNESFASGNIKALHTSTINLSGIITFEELILEDGDYFTLVVDHLPIPLSGMSLWLRADKGVDGNPLINNWTDQSSAQDIYINRGASDFFHTSDQHFNFNPLVRFSGETSKDYFQGSTSTKLSHTFVVANYVTTGGQAGLNSGALIGEWNSTGYLYRDSPDGIAFRTGNNAHNSGQKSKGIHLYSYEAVESGINHYHVDGNEQTLNGASIVKSSVGAHLVGTYTNDPIANTPEAYFKGGLAEIIGFPANLDNTNRIKVESYLAVKYGISLTKDYLASGGESTWDYSDPLFRYHITGIGRDDILGLDQRVSRNTMPGKEMLSIANGATYPTGNFTAQTPQNITSDKNFFLWASNNGTTTFSAGSTTNVYGKFYLLNRKWKTQKTGTDISKVSICFDTTGTSIVFPSKTSDCRKLILITSSSSDFSNPEIKGVSGISSEGRIYFNNVELSNYFTLAVPEISAEIIPSNNKVCSSDPDLKFVLKAKLNTGETGLWTLKSIVGGAESDVVIHNPTANETYATLPSQGNTDLTVVFRWVVTNTLTACKSEELYEIIRHAKPDKPGVDAKVEYCQNEIAIPLTATVWPGHGLFWFEKINGVSVPSGSFGPIPSTSKPGITIYQVIQKNDVTNCISDTSEIEVKVLSIAKHPDIRVHLCLDPDRSITLSRFLDTVDYKIINWAAKSVNTPIPAGPSGLIYTMGLQEKTYVYSYSYETKCYTSNALLYLQPISNRLNSTLVDTLVVCKDVAGNIQLDQVLGLEANGYWTYSTHFDKYVNKIKAPSLMAGAVILEAQKVYDASDLNVYRKPYKGDTNAVYLLFEYHPQSLCLPNTPRKLVVIVTTEWL